MRVKLKWIISSFLIFLIAGFLFYKYFIIIVPKNSIVSVSGYNQYFFIETGQEKILKIAFHTSIRKYEIGKKFSFSGVHVYTPNRTEKVLKNDFHFSVLFPFQETAASDTSLLFNRIRAHAYLALQQASLKISNNFYSVDPQQFKDYSYPSLFQHFLNTSPITNHASPYIGVELTIK